MSAVRMCDDCGAMYSENAEGVTSGTMVNKETGRQTTLDKCDVCSDLTKSSSNQIWRRPANSRSELLGAQTVRDTEEMK